MNHPNQDTEGQGRPPHWDDLLDVERAVLGKLITQGADDGEMDLAPMDFIAEDHARLYRELQDMHRRGIPLTDRAAVNQAFRRARVDLFYQLELSAAAATGNSGAWYAEQVRAASMADTATQQMRATVERMRGCRLWELPGILSQPEMCELLSVLARMQQTQEAAA